MCAGPAIAANRMFLYMAGLIQSFDFHAVTGEIKPNHDVRLYKMGVPPSPKPYKVVAVPRPKNVEYP